LLSIRMRRREVAVIALPEADLNSGWDDFSHFMV